MREHCQKRVLAPVSCFQFVHARAQELFELLAHTDVLNGEEDRRPFVRRMNDLSGVQQQGFPADVFRLVFHLKVFKGHVLAKDFF